MTPREMVSAPHLQALHGGAELQRAQRAGRVHVDRLRQRRVQVQRGRPVEDDRHLRGQRSPHLRRDAQPVRGHVAAHHFQLGHDTFVLLPDRIEQLTQETTTIMTPTCYRHLFLNETVFTVFF